MNEQQFKDRTKQVALRVPAQETELEPTVLDTEPGFLSGVSADVILAAESDIGVKKQVEPVSGSERYFAVDVLRGFALLGILAMNIVGFGWPGPAYDNPWRGGGFEGLDRGVWFFNHLVFDGKMMSIFSMLFGAGLVLMDQRAEARGARVRGVYYRRILWLLGVCLFNATERPPCDFSCLTILR